MSSLRWGAGSLQTFGDGVNEQGDARRPVFVIGEILLLEQNQVSVEKEAGVR